MKPIALASAILMTSFGAYANEALDVLEGKKKASDIALPTARDMVVKEVGLSGRPVHSIPYGLVPCFFMTIKIPGFSTWP
jgi:hypothetical protein